MKKDKDIKEIFPSNFKPYDLTFITNEPNITLKNRFCQLINDAKYFDCLVAYFYLSGFHVLYKPLEKTEKIRILIGIGLDPEIYRYIEETKKNSQIQIQFSHSEVINSKEIDNILQNELEESEENIEIEKGINKFIEWLISGKLEIRAYPSKNIHAKLYIITFKEGDRDVGRVITGSSNFTYSGLIDNLEFNVELKNYADYIYAKSKFDEFWKDSVNVSEKFLITLKEKTWLNQNITPYEIYLKLLYEYFKDELSRAEDIYKKYLPENFKEFDYQKQAVLNAKKILEEYGGVFLSDVVGLGKTYIATMLSQQLDGRILVIAPPALLSENNPGSWVNVLRDFGVSAKCCSIGKLDDAKEYIKRYENTENPVKNIIIDEAHRFRNELTISYEDISEICRGRRVILLSATPYNNSPKDILAQIKLFQNPRKSTIPGISNLEEFFIRIDGRLRNIDRQKEYDKYLDITRENAKEIRDKVLKYIMVRRTRKEIEKYFVEDLKRNNVKFPEIENPILFFYQFSDQEDEIFMKTVKLITTEFKYARYMPLLYWTKRISQFEEQSQKNMGGFMKVLLVKRLESSFHAFRNSINRFIDSYEKFIKEFEKGNVYISKEYINKVFELIEQDDDEAIQKLIEEGKVQKYDAKEFRPEFEKDLKNDYEILKNIKLMWEGIKRDPKLETLLHNLKNNPILKGKKIIIFTESKETAEYLTTKINNEFGLIALLFHGGSPAYIKDRIIENFDARAQNKRDDYKILVSTEVLSEGVNLHRSNMVINYDIPWNPTKLIQRVGRINRIDTPFDKIYIFNFLPTKQSDSEIELTNIARYKIEAFLTLLGGDSSILTEGEPVSSHELFDKLISKKYIMEEDELEESELKYLKVIEKIRDNDPELFNKIKNLPKKARTSKVYNFSLENIGHPNSLLTFFRKGKLMKFYLSTENNTIELDFLTAVKIFECTPDEKKTNLPLERYYELLFKNKDAFYNATIEEIISGLGRRGRDRSLEILKFLKIIQKNCKQLTDDQEEYLKLVIRKLEEGSLPKGTIKRTFQELNKIGNEILNKPLQFIGILQKCIPENLLREHYVSYFSANTSGKREIILSLYLSGGNENG